MSRLLINEQPLLILPTLAAIIGLNEAIILQQVHYWLSPSINKNIRDGRHWVYNTYAQWAEQFPFLSDRTVRRAIESLEKQNLLSSANHNASAINKTKWYTINYDALEAIEPFGQIGQMNRPNRPIEVSKTDTLAGQTGHLYNGTETTTQTTTENTIPSLTLPSAATKEREREMILIWNEVMGREEGVKLTPKRKQQLANILEEELGGELKAWKAICCMFKSSDFLMGKTNKSKFVASLDWVLDRNNLIKVMEGNYGSNISLSTLLEEEQMSNELDESEWGRICAIMKEQYGEATYKSWFAKLVFEELDEVQLIISAPLNFIKEWIETNYKSKIEAAAAVVTGDHRKLVVRVTKTEGK